MSMHAWSITANGRQLNWKSTRARASLHLHMHFVSTWLNSSCLIPRPLVTSRLAPSTYACHSNSTASLVVRFAYTNIMTLWCRYLDCLHSIGVCGVVYGHLLCFTIFVQASPTPNVYTHVCDKYVACGMPQSPLVTSFFFLWLSNSSF